MDLLKENIPLLVRKLAIQASVGTLFQTLYNIVPKVNFLNCYHYVNNLFIWALSRRLG